MVNPTGPGGHSGPSLSELSSTEYERINTPGQPPKKVTLGDLITHASEAEEQLRAVEIRLQRAVTLLGWHPAPPVEDDSKVIEPFTPFEQIRQKHRENTECHYRIAALLDYLFEVLS